MSEKPKHPPNRLAPNRLAEESSPYLRQHALNPVNWYPWGDEALARAKAEDRPIFLSVGYSACHWCHVMAHESFEDGDTAAFLNEHFVPVKLDREERPDLDALYMRSVMLMTGSGGWPLSVFLTPDLKPFFGGTYFPKDQRYGMPSFLHVLRGVAEAYRKRRGDVLTSADGLLEAVRESFGRPEGPTPGPRAALASRRAILERFDPRHGGFGQGPKFPQPPLLEFLLDEADRSGDEALQGRVLFTLDRMEAGGVRDQVGGAFHRYSVDGEWRVPHYEKMLYDNAQLAALYARASLITGRAHYSRVADEILADLRKTMAAPGGGFVAALDADSEGEEGLFYLWTPDELEAALGHEDGRMIASLFGITSGEGLEHRTLHRTADRAEAAQRAGQEEAAFAARVKRALVSLEASRAKRIPPGVDTKVLTDWNALAAEGFLCQAMATGSKEDLETGLGTLRAIWQRCEREGVLLHAWDGERAKIPGFLADYAYLARAEWRAYEATGDPEHLARVETLLLRALERFGGGGRGPWNDAAGEEGGLILPVRDADDGVLPAALSVVAQVLWNWERLTGAAWATEALEALLAAEGGALERNPGAQPLLAGLAASRALPPVEVVVSGPEMPAIAALLRAARESALAGALVLPLLRRGDGRAYPLFEGRGGGRPRAFVCVDRSCDLPVEDAAELREKLEAARHRIRAAYREALDGGE
jgi:uncharacterized protein